MSKVNKPKLDLDNKEQYLNDLYNIIKSQGQKLYVKVEPPDSLWFRERDWGESLANKSHRTIDPKDGSSSLLVRVDIFIEYLYKYREHYSNNEDGEEYYL